VRDHSGRGSVGRAVERCKTGRIETYRRTEHAVSIPYESRHTVWRTDAPVRADETDPSHSGDTGSAWLLADGTTLCNGALATQNAENRILRSRELPNQERLATDRIR